MVKGLVFGVWCLVFMRKNQRRIYNSGSSKILLCVSVGRCTCNCCVTHINLHSANQIIPKPFFKPLLYSNPCQQSQKRNYNRGDKHNFLDARPSYRFYEFCHKNYGRKKSNHNRVYIIRQFEQVHH